MKLAKAFIVAGAGIALALALAVICFAADALFDGFDGTEGQHVVGWYDNENPGQSYASGVDFLYSSQSSCADMVTLTDTQGYGEVYMDFITADTSVYKYLQVKIESVTNTSTAWEIGVNTFSPDTWLGNMSHVPCAEATTATGFFEFDISALMPAGEPHHFVINFTVTGVLDGEDYYGYDGDTVRVDYIRLTDTSGEQPTPEITPTPPPMATPTPAVGRRTVGYTTRSEHSFFGWMAEFFGF